eukprot:scaffold1482_cov120-Cylindrotheca_fusiformis.AAC.9
MGVILPPVSKLISRPKLPSQQHTSSHSHPRRMLMFMLRWGGCDGLGLRDFFFLRSKNELFAGYRTTIVVGTVPSFKSSV